MTGVQGGPALHAEQPASWPAAGRKQPVHVKVKASYYELTFAL